MPTVALHLKPFAVKDGGAGWLNLENRFSILVPKRLKSKLNLRWRLGTFLGNSQTTNECFVAAVNGDVIKTRSMTRVVEGNRWSSDAILKIKGTPDLLRPQAGTESDAEIEELIDPHKNADEDMEGDEQQSLAQKLRRIRMTANDFKLFGHSDGCKRCDEMKRGVKISGTNHSDECRLRIYYQYKEHNHEKWQRVKHLIEGPSFKPQELDAEGSPITPKADHEKIIFEGEQTSARPGEANNIHANDDLTPSEIDAMEFEDVVPKDNLDTTDFHNEVNEDAEMHSADAADIFGPSDDEDMEDSQGIDSMVSYLQAAGADASSAIRCARAMYGVQDNSEAQSSIMEVYGTSIHAQLNRRNLNIKGLGALDLRTLKPNQQPWDFTKRSDRQEARDLINRLQPQWIIGSPPCTPYSIWNFGINYKRMDQEKAKKMLAEGQVHLNFMCSLYRNQIRRGRYFLHEHPATALSWKEEQIKSLMK